MKYVLWGNKLTNFLDWNICYIDYIWMAFHQYVLSCDGWDEFFNYIKDLFQLLHIYLLTRIAAHGPPVATPAAAELSKDALKNLKIVYGERFCTQTWFQGKTSNTVQALKNKSWDW